MSVRGVASWVGHLFCSGHTTAEVAAILGRAEIAVFEYFIDWLKADTTGAWKQAVHQFVSPDDLQAIILELRAQNGRLSIAYESLRGRYTLNQLRLTQIVWRKTV